MSALAERDRETDVRMDRVAECFLASLPAEDEIRRAEVRLAARAERERRPIGKVLLVAAVQGFVIGVATLATAAWISHRIADGEAPARSAVEARPAAPPAAVARRLPRTEPVQAPLAPPPVAAFDDAARPPDGVATRPARPGPRSAEELPAPLVPAPEVPSLVAPELALADGPWAQVARALERGDRAGADAVLESLAQDPRSRDAAELTRAQLAVADGRGESFRAELTRLASEGRTALTRRRAAELLARLGQRR